MLWLPSKLTALLAENGQESSTKIQGLDVEISGMDSKNTESVFRRTTSERFIARRTESIDAERISELVSRHTEKVFGRTDVEKIM